MFRGRQPSQWIKWLSLGIVIVAVFAVPLGYYYLSYQYIAGEIEGEIGINARLATEIINSNPELWELEQIRLTAALEHGHGKENPEIRRILNSKNEVVAEYVSKIDSPVMKKESVLMDSGSIVGRIEIFRSLRPLLIKTLILAALSVSTGIGIFVLILFVPVRTMALKEEAVRLTEKALRLSQERLSKAQKMAHIGNWEENYIDKKLYWSDEVYRIYGVEAQQYIPSFESVSKAMHPDDLQPFLKAVDAALRELKPFEMDYRLVRPDGSVRTVHTIGEVIYDSKGSPVMLTGTVQDITDNKRAEEQLRSALREKETLLRELYHRTKNNMQVIMSLINLQLASTNGNRESQALKETQHRILSMSLVHEKLYNSKDLSNVNLKNYLEDLTGALLRSYQSHLNAVSIRMEVDDIMLSIDTIMPIGLIINELMTNSLKYAFQGRDCGEIRIDGRISEAGEIEIHYCDDGIGLPQDFDLSKTSSLGLKLVHNLVAGQLMGKIRVATDSRPEYSIIFKEPLRKKRM